LNENDEKEVVNIQNLRLSKPRKKAYKQVMQELVTGFIDRRLKITFIDLDTEE